MKCEWGVSSPLTQKGGYCHKKAIREITGYWYCGEHSNHQLDSKRVELCGTCHHRIDLESGPPFCKHNLYPLTLAGENCPYYQLEDNKVDNEKK